MIAISLNSKPARALLRASRLPKRIYLRNCNSKPYISGDAFADSSDFQAFPPHRRKVDNQYSELKVADVIFCPSHNIEEFIETFGSQIHAKVLILGNSDREFPDFQFQLPKNVKHVFAQNTLFPNSNFVTGIPIGIENLRLGVNGNPRLYKESIQDQNSRVLIGPFGMTHSERNELLPLKTNYTDMIEYCDERLTPRQYSKLAANYSYIAAPRGNGIDTHRLWETLYRGAIPIVRDTVWLRNFGFLDEISISLTSWDYEEIALKVHSRKLDFFDPKKIPQLWWPYWESLIKEKL
jgi:hypothetical protein